MSTTLTAPTVQTIQFPKLKIKGKEYELAQGLYYMWALEEVKINPFKMQDELAKAIEACNGTHLCTEMLAKMLGNQVDEVWVPAPFEAKELPLLIPNKTFADIMAMIQESAKKAPSAAVSAQEPPTTPGTTLLN